MRKRGNGKTKKNRKIKFLSEMEIRINCLTEIRKEIS